MNRKMKTKKIPGNTICDNSLCLLLEGYLYIQNRRIRYNTDIFQTRLLGKKAICISGEDAARFFYNNEYFKRKEVAPKRIQKTLVGENGVQGLDGADHMKRKEMFMSLMTPKSMMQLSEFTKEQWEINSKKWNNKTIILFDEAQTLLCQVACRWAQVPLYPKEAIKRANDLGKMIDGFGAVGPRHWQGRCARKRSEKWIEDIIVKIRRNQIRPSENSAAYAIAWAKDVNGKLLGRKVAAVELLNIIRPIVAIATYITFGVLAMIENPDCRIKLALNGDAYNEMFVQEVRRFYPFTPYVAAQLKKDVIWKGYLLKKGTLTLLDVYGIIHDNRLWAKPYDFIPERFKNRSYSKYSFIPQGGGDYNSGHRCAGEFITIEVMKTSFNYITNHLVYRVPKQNTSYRLTRIPTLPKSRLVLKVKLKEKGNKM